MQIKFLDPDQTNALVGQTHRSSPLVEAVFPLTDTGQSAFVVGLNEVALTSLRNALRRRGVLITVKKTWVDGEKGHVIIPRSAA